MFSLLEFLYTFVDWIHLLLWRSYTHKLGAFLLVAILVVYRSETEREEYRHIVENLAWASSNRKKIRKVMKMYQKG